MEIIGEFEILIISSIVITIIFVVFNLFSLLFFLFNKFLRKKKTQVSESIITTNKFTKFSKGILQFDFPRYMLANIFMVILFMLFLYLAFRPGEFVESTYPSDNGQWSDYEKPVEIVFNRPIRPEKLEVFISDDIEGEWKYVKSFSFLPFVRKVEFHPKESFLPNELIKLYIVNFNRFDIGEYPFNFYTATLPKVNSINPIDNQKDLMTDVPIIIQLDKNAGNYTDIDVQVAPAIEFDKVIDQNQIIIKPKSNLKQTTKYTVSVYQSAQKYKLDDKQITFKGSKNKIHESSFSTIKAPLLESFSPQGTGVRSDAQVKVIFDEVMNKKEVESAFSITPQTQGEIIWEDDRTFVFKPSILEKEKKYSVTFAKGITSNSGGKTEDEIKFEFETVGAVRVLSFSPSNGFNGADINGSVFINFDQEVDKSSAQSKFSISPAIDGTFSWNQNTMIFKPNAPFEYSTSYSVTILAGVKTIYGFDSTQLFSAAFTTRTSVFVLNISHLYQQNTFGCNSTAMAMVMNYRGVATSESQVYNGAGSGPQPNKASGGNPHLGWVPDYGVYWEPVAAYARSRGLSAQVYQNMSLTAALKEVEQGNPVVVWWQNGVSTPTNISWTASDGQSIHAVNGMHSVVIIGYQGTPENPSTVYYHDPYFGATRSRSAASFDSLWSTWRMGSVPDSYRRVGLVVK